MNQLTKTSLSYQGSPEITAFVGGKGGGGKTLIACNLHFRLLKEGKRVLHIDLDYPQHTSYKFFRERRELNGLEPLNIIKMNPKELNKEKLLRLEASTDHIILEYGKGVEDSMKWVMKFANRLVMILQPEAFDHESIGDVEIEYHKFGNKEVPGVIIVNRVTNLARFNNFIKTDPKPTYFKFADNYISQFKCYSDAAADGKSILEIPKTTKQIVSGHREIELIFKEIF